MSAARKPSWAAAPAGRPPHGLVRLLGVPIARTSVRGPVAAGRCRLRDPVRCMKPRPLSIVHAARGVAALCLLVGVAACSGAAAAGGGPSPSVASRGGLPSAAPRALPAAPETSASAPSSPAPSSPAPAPSPSAGAVGAQPAAVDLFRPGDFVSEARGDWCVPAAIEMMAVMGGLPSRRLPGQSALNLRARALSSSRLAGAGSEPRGWAGVLNQLGVGPYRVVALGTFREAVAVAARAVLGTGRPVGLLVWRGAHAWVMSGFTAAAGPARGDMRVTGVRISDPWYPRPAPAFRRPHRPDALVGLAELARNFLPYRRPVSYPGLDGRYLLVLPVAAGG